MGKRRKLERGSEDFFCRRYWGAKGGEEDIARSEKAKNLPEILSQANPPTILG